MQGQKHPAWLRMPPSPLLTSCVTLEKSPAFLCT